ncbi:MAG: hypothetical protein J6T69_01530 [Methanobrevibacter sp.]|nr:hypothetical protein [Methanobrevibacter sp.]
MQLGKVISPKERHFMEVGLSPLLLRGLIPNIIAVCRFMQHKSTLAKVMMLYY